MGHYPVCGIRSKITEAPRTTSDANRRCTVSCHRYSRNQDTVGRGKGNGQCNMKILCALRRTNRSQKDPRQDSEGSMWELLQKKSDVRAARTCRCTKNFFGLWKVKRLIGGGEERGKGRNLCRDDIPLHKDIRQGWDPEAEMDFSSAYGE